MKLPWSKPETKTAPPLVALAQLPNAAWGRVDPAALARDGYLGNAVAYRCVRLIAEAAASIAFVSAPERVERLLAEPSPDQSGPALLERLYSDLQITGNAYLEAVTVANEMVPRGLFPLRVDSVRVRENQRGEQIGYAVQLKHGKRDISPEADGWSPVLHLKFYHPANAHYGLSTGR